MIEVVLVLSRDSISQQMVFFIFGNKVQDLHFNMKIWIFHAGEKRSYHLRLKNGPCVLAQLKSGDFSLLKVCAFGERFAP